MIFTKSGRISATTVLVPGISELPLNPGFIQILETGIFWGSLIPAGPQPQIGNKPKKGFFNFSSLVSSAIEPSATPYAQYSSVFDNRIVLNYSWNSGPLECPPSLFYKVKVRSVPNLVTKQKRITICRISCVEDYGMAYDVRFNLDPAGTFPNLLVTSIDHYVIEVRDINNFECYLSPFIPFVDGTFNRQNFPSTVAPRVHNLICIFLDSGSQIEFYSEQNFGPISNEFKSIFNKNFNDYKILNLNL